jgi:serine protein kinase
MSRIITKTRARDEEQAKKYSDLMKNLIELGYSEHSAEVVLTYAANNLWKD